MFPPWAKRGASRARRDYNPVALAMRKPPTTIHSVAATRVSPVATCALPLPVRAKPNSARRGAEARREFEAALRLRPDDTGYRTNLGTAYLQKADFDSAITQFKTALNAAPQDATLHYDLGLALKLKDQLPDAVAEFEKAAELDPKLADAHYTLGVTWQQSDILI